jgi:hypothetical protein
VSERSFRRKEEWNYERREVEKDGKEHWQGER